MGPQAVERPVDLAVDAPEIADPRLRRAVRAVHHELATFDDPLRAESRLALAVERLAAPLRRGRGPAACPDPHAPDLAEAARALLDGWDAGPVAAEVGFRRHVGTTTGRFATSQAGTLHR